MGTSYIWSSAPIKGYAILNMEDDLQLICRALISQVYIPGRIENGICYIPYGGKEYQTSVYEDLYAPLSCYE